MTKCPYCAGSMSSLNLIMSGRSLYVCEATRGVGDGTIAFTRCGATVTR